MAVSLHETSRQFGVRLHARLDNYEGTATPSEAAVLQLIQERDEAKRLLAAVDDKVLAARSAIEDAESAQRTAEHASEQLLENVLARWVTSSGARAFSGGLTAVALAIAGRRREAMRVQWQSHLAGAPEAGFRVTPWVGVRDAIGFVLAALRLRVRDLTAPLWGPVDWVIASASRTNTTITAAVGALIVYIQWRDGLHVLITEGWGWCGGCGAALYGLALWLRRVRGITPQEEKPSAE
ncbi:hypothetical protein ACWGI0_23160 [Streptomyces sp. NPDC054802]